MLQRVREQLLLLPCAAANQAHVLDEAHLHRVAALYALQVSLVNVAAVCLCKKSFEFALLRVCPCNNWHRIIPPPILARFHFLLLLSRLPPPLTSSPSSSSCHRPPTPCPQNKQSILISDGCTRYKRSVVCAPDDSRRSELAPGIFVESRGN